MQEKLSTQQQAATANRYDSSDKPVWAGFITIWVLDGSRMMSIWNSRSLNEYGSPFRRVYLVSHSSRFVRLNLLYAPDFIRFRELWRMFKLITPSSSVRESCL